MALDIQAVIGDSGQRKDGVWVDYPDEDGVKFRLAYLGNNDYQDFVSERMMKARRGRRDIPSDKQRKIIVEGLVKHILKGWEGLSSGGENFEFNPINAKVLLEQSATIRDWVITEANSLDNFGTSQEDESPTGDIKSGPPVGSRVGQ